MTGRHTLLFVYNADSDLFNTVADIGHKIFSPETYSCRLCDLTHGYFSMRTEWKSFIEGLGIPCEFLHRDELIERYGEPEVPLPGVFRRTAEGVLEVCLDATAIGDCDDPETLSDLIREVCAEQGD